MDLGLEVAPIQREELGKLLVPRKPREKQGLNKLTERHHLAARLLAEDTPPGVVAAQCRYSQSRIAILQADPLFAELVAFYSQGIADERERVGGKYLAAGATAVDLLMKRLEKEPNSFDNGDLVNVAAKLGDRGGLAPTKGGGVTVNVGGDFSERLARARERQVEGEVIEQSAKL